MGVGGRLRLLRCTISLTTLKIQVMSDSEMVDQGGEIESAAQHSHEDGDKTIGAEQLKQAASSSKRQSQINFTKSEQEKEVAHRSKPLIDRITDTVIHYKWSLVVSLAVVAIVGIVHAASPSAVADLEPKWEAYFTIFLTTIALLLMMDNKPPELVSNVV